MAGLGAFGGANLGAALSSTGTEAAKLSMLPEGGMTIAESLPASMGGTAPSTGSLLADVVGKTATSGPMSMAPWAQPSVASQLGMTAAPVAMTPSQVAALQSTAPTGFSSVGSGLSDLASLGGFSRFKSAFAQQAGGPFGTQLATTGLTAPILEGIQPAYESPETTVADSNYAGPYKPSERQVRYPGAERDKEDSSEFLYFSPTNPYPGFVSAASGGSIGYQEGGTVEVPAAPERMLNMPAPTYMHGTAPEFNYNFRPVEVYTPPPAAAPAQGQNVFGAMFGGNLFNKASPNGDSEEMRTDTEGSGLGSIFKGIFKRDREKEEGNYTDLSKYKYDAATQRMVPTTTDMAQGGLAGLNAFNKGGAPKGRFLRGPGDGTSDSIPATIGGTQPARLADGEFVIDARTVSEIGNGSSKAGAKKLYAMMERVHKARKGAKRGQNSNADRYLPA